ncbi:acetyl-coenzyme A transporter 1-like isoform X2 [Aphis craccivora]|uniref:Acetyl-coenzyme A transporter 1-like isoform X2 n=1 Tax=Aphis craccivora TaxID=307492 RepID=A0A6G0YJV9_APHCR|nr:acetyl-coenzyme A transporter 1-like isoform X2 [Aphis craccivora]
MVYRNAKTDILKLRPYKIYIVDGWALTILKKLLCVYTCNATDQGMGIMISSVFYVFLTSEDFSNKYLQIMSDVRGVFTLWITGEGYDTAIDTGYPDSPTSNHLTW